MLCYEVETALLPALPRYISTYSSRRHDWAVTGQLDGGKGEMLVDLEQRVKTLEYEIKILKADVQRTLLDIQEQVLVHYYPALRTEEEKPSEGTIQAIEALRSRQTPRPTEPTATAVEAPAESPAAEPPSSP